MTLALILAALAFRALTALGEAFTVAEDAREG
jgi:hypothetical protein